MPYALSTPSPALSKRIRTISRTVQLMAHAGMVLSCLVVAIVWSNADLVRSLVVPQVGLHNHTVTMTPATQAAGFGLSLIPLALFVYTLHLVARLFGAFARGFVFDTDNAKTLKTLGCTLIAAALAAIVARTGLALILTLGNEPGQRILSIGLDGGHYGGLLGGGAVLAFAMVFEEAVRLSDENRSFV